VFSWRKMTWAILIWTALFVVWSFAGADNSDAVADCVRDSGGLLTRSDCETAANVGTGIGIALIWTLWFIGFVVLSIAWFMTKPKDRACPACGSDVRRGLTICASCGFDFAQAALPSVAPPQPPA
jgi:hypothetical protein